jgi:hypothetical protein
MRRTLVLLVAIVVLVAAGAALAPAAILGVAVERLSGSAATLAETEGTVWRGRGTLSVRTALRVPLAWRIDPLPLVHGEARIAILSPAAGDAPHADVSARAGAVVVRALDLALPAEALGAVAPRAGVRLQGELRVTSPSLQWTPTAFGGGARVEWRDARFAIANDVAIRLGAVSANLAAAGDRLTGPVTNEGGDFDLRGTASLRANGSPDVALTITPREGDPAQARSLSVVARPDGAGWNVDYRVGPR